MAWPTKTAVAPYLPLTKRVFGLLAAVSATTKVKPAPPWTDRITFGPVAVSKGEETAQEWSVVPPAWKEVEAAASVVAVPMTVTFSMPSPEIAVGPSLSATEREAKGLPLPFPSVLANPARLGPPRFTALDRKTLGLD